MPPLQGSVTCEYEDLEGLVQSSLSNQTSTTNNHNNTVLANQSVLRTAASRPNPQGGQVTSTPRNVDNRLVINAKQNKNREAQKSPQAHIGNGDMTANVVMNSEHIAKITLQQQELLKKQTQQLIQLKLQQEAKKQLQLNQIKQQPPQNENERKMASARLMQNGSPAQVNNAISAAVKNLLKVPVKNNVNMKTAVEAPASPKAVEPRNNIQQKQIKLNVKVTQPNEVVSRQIVVESPQPQLNRKGKKPIDNLQQQQSPRTPPRQSMPFKPVEVIQAPCVGHPVRQNGVGPPGSPSKGQVRQPPQGQAQNGDAKTPDSNKQRESGKVKAVQDESPPSDQVHINFL